MSSFLEIITQIFSVVSVLSLGVREPNVYCQVPRYGQVVYSLPSFFDTVEIVNNGSKIGCEVEYGMYSFSQQLVNETYSFYLDAKSFTFQIPNATLKGILETALNVVDGWETQQHNVTASTEFYTVDEQRRLGMVSDEMVFQINCAGIFASVTTVARILVFPFISLCALLIVGSLCRIAGQNREWMYQRIKWCYNVVYSPIGTPWYSTLLMKLIERPMIDACTIRSIFGKLPQVKIFKAANHTHGQAAAERNASATVADLLAKMLGTQCYYVQKSAADVRNGREGARSYHWAKDLTVGPALFNPPENSILAITDVDMYLDMPSMLARFPRTYIISTFQPSTVSKSNGEYSFFFDEDNVVHYNVSGGATYEHQVWNYGTDVLLCKERILGLWCYTVYNVDRKQQDSHHQSILLTPIKTFRFPLFDIGKYLYSAPLTRLQVHEKLTKKIHKDDNTTEEISRSFSRLTAHTADGPRRSTGYSRSYLCADITAIHDDAIACQARLSKLALTVAQIKSTVQDISQDQAVILTEFHRLSVGKLPEMVYPVASSVNKFQYNPSTYDPDAKNGLIPYMSPIVLGAYSPDRCYANDEQAYLGRIKEVEAKADMTPELLKYAQEFIEFLIPVPNIGHPVDIEEVYDKQNRPTQRAILDAASLVAANVVDEKVSTFQKTEAYGKVTDPRIISTVPGVNKRNYSEYMYAYTAVLRATDWYAFGKTPAQIAERIANLCAKAASMSNTDLSRMDGRTSRLLRVLEHMAMMRYFALVYHMSLSELMATQHNQRARTTFGLKYETKWARLSGSAETADFNSQDAGFIIYVANRRTAKPNGDKMSPAEAWEKIGLVGGDDGCTEVDKPQFETACKDVGQLGEIDVIARGKLGVSFLARLYSSDVWYGCRDSICDVKRALAKFHTTIALDSTVTPLEKFCEKIVALSFSDENTPIFSQLIAAAFKVIPTLGEWKLKTDRLRGVYNGFMLSSEQYPNEFGDWMEEYISQQMPNFDRQVFTNWINALEAGKDVAGLLKPPLCDETELENHGAKKSVVVNGEVFGPPNRPAAQEKVPTQGKVGVCRDYIATGKCEYGAEKCKYNHTDCKHFKTGSCNRDPCRFRHA